MTDTLKEPLLADGAEQVGTYRATAEDEPSRVGSFKTPKDYLKNLAYSTNLNELYDITGVQVTNAWQSHNQPYVIVVDVKEENLQELYKGKYLIQIWKKVGDEQGTLMYEKPCQNAPGDFCIRRELCVYLTEDSSSSSINNDVETISHNINIIDVNTQKEFQMANPFGASEGTQAYIDDDILVVGSGKQIYVYETKSLIAENNLAHKELAIKCDQIMDINFTAVGKSYVVVSTTNNDGKQVQYHRINLAGEVKDQKSAHFMDKQLSTSVMATFNCEIQGEKYVKCAIQPYDFYVLLTDKGNFEIFKFDGEKPPKLQFSSFKFFNPDANASVGKTDKIKENKTKILREMLDAGLTDIRIVYNFLCMKTKTQKKTYYVSVAKLQEFYPQIQNEEFDETMLQLAMFNPVFFNNHTLNEEDIMLTHERFVSIKNIPTGLWQHIELYPVDSHFRKKEAKLQVLSIYKVDEKQTFIVSKKDRKGWLIENKRVPAPEVPEGQEPPAEPEEPSLELKWQSEEIDLQEGDDTKYIQHVWQCQNNLGVFYFDMRSEILSYRSIQKLEIKKKKLAFFFDHVVPDVNHDFKFIPIKQTGNQLLFILWNQETKKAGIHKEEMKPKQRKEYKDVSLAMHTFSGVESISAASFKRDSILILMNGMFYEFNLTESRLITHTKPTRGGIEKPPIETEELYIFNERFLYFIDEQDYVLYIADLTQFRAGGFQIKDFVKVEVTSTFHRNLGFDLENERILVAKSRFEVQIMPFLHQSRIIFFKVMNNPDNFILHEHHKDKIYGFDQKGMLTVWNAINTHLDSYSQIGKEVVDMSEWQYICMAGKHALLMKKEIPEEGKAPVKHEEVDHTYKAIHLDFEEGQCQIKQSVAYTHRHKKFTNVRFSHDMKRMLEQNGKSDTCIIYELDIETGSRWIKIRELQDIKALAQVSPCMKYFYSPSTTKFLDIDVKGIVEQDDQPEKFKLPAAIARNTIEIMMKHDDHFVVIMKNNIAKEFQIVDGNNIVECRYFIHHYDDPSVTRQYHTKSRIIFIAQKEELMQQLARLNDFYRFQQKYNDVCCKYKHDDTMAEDIKYHAMFSICDTFVDNKSQVNFPFTYFHWSLAEKLATQEVRMPLLNKQIIQELMFLIDPEGNSLMHKLSKQFRALKFCYDTINDEFSGIEKAPKCLDMIPYICNLNLVTPLKIAGDERDTKSCDQMLLMLKKAEVDNHEDEMQEFYQRAFEFNLTNIGDYFDKRLIPSDQLGLKIERGGLELGPGGFALTTVAIGENDTEKVIEETCVQGNIEVPIIMQVLDMPGIHRFDKPWSKDLLKSLADTPRLEIFQNKSLRGVLEYKWPQIKNSLLYRLFLPYMLFLMVFLFYSVYILNYYQFVNNLKDLNDLVEKKGTTLEYACQKSFFSDDNYQWQQEHLFNKSADDMDAMCTAYEQSNKAGDKYYNWVLWKNFLKAFIIICVFYFFFNEARQMSNGVLNYLFNMWNYIDIIPLALITCVMILDWIIGNKTENQKFMRSILSLAIFFLWVKFLYFLRLFRGTSYLITMILEVVKDMKTFLLLFLVSTLAFGNCFYVFNQNLGGDSFIKNYFQSFTYAYEMVLGNFDTEKYKSGDNKMDYLVLYTLFVMSTLFLMIVMLNLLIAIISDSYGRVQQQAANLMYKGMADLIYENDYLLSYFQLKAFHDKAGDYLVLVASEEEGADTSSVEGKLAALQDMIATNHSALYGYVRNMKKDMDESSDKTSGFQTRVEGKMAKVEVDIQTIAKEIKKQAEQLAAQAEAAAETAAAELEGEEEKKQA